MHKASPKVNSVRNNGPEMPDEVYLLAQPGERRSSPTLTHVGRGLDHALALDLLDLFFLRSPAFPLGLDDLLPASCRHDSLLRLLLSCARRPATAPGFSRSGEKVPCAL